VQNLRKRPQKKGKNCQSFETTKIEKNKNKKNIGSDITNRRHISFLSLDNETVEIHSSFIFQIDNLVSDFLTLQQRPTGMVFVKIPKLVIVFFLKVETFGYPGRQKRNSSPASIMYVCALAI
jgi:hypothetical protein